MLPIDQEGIEGRSPILNCLVDSDVVASKKLKSGLTSDTTFISEPGGRVLVSSGNSNPSSFIICNFRGVGINLPAFQAS